MSIQRDISINIPIEYLDALSDIISVGFQRSKIDTETKQQLIAWWDIEKEIIEEIINTK